MEGKGKKENKKPREPTRANKNAAHSACFVAFNKNEAVMIQKVSPKDKHWLVVIIISSNLIQSPLTDLPVQ